MWWCLSALAGSEPPPGGWPAPPASGTVTSVYDGDTMTLASGDKIRLKWVNTPEMKPLEPFAKEAQAFTSQFVMGQEVTLITDPRDARDGYGRIVAGVRTSRGDLSTELLRAGYAHLFVIPPDNTDLAPMIAAQEEARKARRGIWTDEMFQGELHFTSFHANAPGDDNTNVNGEYMRICNISSHEVNLDGWRLVDRTGHSHRLPSLVVPAGQTFKVMSGTGTTGKASDGGLEVYLGSAEPLWNNELETIELFDPSGKRVDRREHKGSRD
jgi:micrococcal nuclease